jgi:flavin reductase (DIM6/NTAB) family NADH-FMN oxidoreductase RutF
LHILCSVTQRILIVCLNTMAVESTGKEAQAEVPNDLPPDLRDTLARVPTPVTVVTTLHDGHPHGTTVSAFCSLSAKPPLVLIALDGSSNLLNKLRQTLRFGITVLAHDQHQVAISCASKRENKFDDIPWHVENGLPRIDGAAGWFLCEVHDLLPGGDHTIVIGRVHAHHSSDTTPLVYHEREFGVPKT